MEKKGHKKYRMKENLFKEKMVKELWEMLKWMTEFIHQHQEEWEQRRKEQELYAMAELDEWNRMKRFGKINRIKNKWNKKTQNKQLKSQKIPGQFGEQRNLKQWV